VFINQSFVELPEKRKYQSSQKTVLKTTQVFMNKTPERKKIGQGKNVFHLPDMMPIKKMI